MKNLARGLGGRDAALVCSALAFALVSGLDVVAEGRIHLTCFYLGAVIPAALRVSTAWAIAFAVASAVAGALVNLPAALQATRMGLELLAANQLIALAFYGTAVFFVARWRSGAEPSSFLQPSDKVSGLLGEAAFADCLVEEIAKLSRTRRSFALLYLDCDDLAGIVPTLSKYDADKLQAGVGRAIRMAIRKSDKAARLSGREFSVLLCDIAPDDVPSVAEKILGSIHLGACGLPRTVTFSVGAVSYRQPVDSYAQARDLAPRVMGAAKDLLATAQAKSQPKVSCAAF